MKSKTGHLSKKKKERGQEAPANVLYFFQFLSIKNYSMACYLCVSETSSTIFNNTNPFENLDTNNMVLFSFISLQAGLKNKT